MSDLAMPMPETSPEAAMPDAGAVPEPTMSLQDDFDRAQARFEEASAAKEKLEAIEHELTELGKKADTVTGEDVVQSAGRLIARGLDVTQMASLLADMPVENGQLLAEWLGQQKQELDAAMQQFGPAYSVVKHDLGVTALRMLALEAMPQQTPTMDEAEALPPSMASGNPLAPRQ